MNNDQSIPQFIIVGAMKAGTTTLAFHLNNHPKIHVPGKEVHFFNHHDEFEKGIEYYQSKLTKDAGSEAELIGEKTPTYSYMKEVPERIKSMCPTSKIIWIFRDPVERAFSNYMHAKRAGVEELSFADALEQEDKRIISHIKYGYRTRSQYADQVERYLLHFPLDQMFFMKIDEMMQPFDSTHKLNALFAFLGVGSDGYHHQEVIKNKTSYKMKRPSDGLIGRLKSRLMGVTQDNSVDLEAQFKKELTDQNEALREYFRPYNDRLLKLTGVDLNA
jgi:hypothetical protein